MLWFLLSLVLSFLLPRLLVFQVRDRRLLRLWLLSMRWLVVCPVRSPWVVRGALIWLSGGFSRRLLCLRFRAALGVWVVGRSRLGRRRSCGRWRLGVVVCFRSPLLPVRLGCSRRGRRLAVLAGLVLALGRRWRSRWVWGFLVRCFFPLAFCVPRLGVWCRLAAAGSFLLPLPFPSCPCFSCGCGFARLRRACSASGAALVLAILVSAIAIKLSKNLSINLLYFTIN